MIKKLGWIFWLYVAVGVMMAASLVLYAAAELTSLILMALAAVVMVPAVVLHWIYKVRHQEPVGRWAVIAVGLALCLILCAVSSLVSYMA